MKTKTGIKSGKLSLNHSEAQAKAGQKVQSGGINLNHSEAQAKGGLKVQTGIKSGLASWDNHNEAQVRRS